MNKNIIVRLGLIALIAWLVPVAVAAQGVCHIQGHMEKDSLRFTKAKIEKLYLSKLNEFDQFVKIDSTSVVNGDFKFQYTLKENEPIVMFFITGFDNGDIPVWVEPGTVTVSIHDAAFASGARVSGTATNNLYAEYKAINQRCINVQQDSIRQFVAKYGEAYMDSPEGMARLLRSGAAEVLVCEADRLQFLLDHNDSPLAPIMLERELAYNFDADYANKLVKALSPTLHKHPYYQLFSNYIKAQNLKAGGELPDVKLPLISGETKYLSDYAGKYVILDFWASWCAPCLKELPYIRQIYELTQAHKDKMVLISFSLDNKKNNWLNGMKKHNLENPGWVHASDLLGWGSQTAKLLGVEAIPQIIVVDPEGKAVSFKLRGEELVKKVKELCN